MVGKLMNLIRCVAVALVCATVASAQDKPSQEPQTNKVIYAESGKYQFTMDTSVAPDLSDWALRELAPVVQKWYPRIVALLPSEGFEASTNVTIRGYL